MSRKINYKKTEHALSLVNRLHEMRNEEKHCDFVIKVGYERIPAHRSVLTAMSDYFDRMLSHDTIENTSGVVNMKDVNPECVRICIDFMYGRECEVSEQNYEDLIQAASLMQLIKLRDIVGDFIAENLNLKSFFSIQRIAETSGSQILMAKCKEFACKNFSAISMEKEFGDLDRSYVIKLLESKNVKMTEEEKIQAALRWVGNDVQRGDELVYFLQCIDLNQVPLEKRQQLLKHNPLVKGNSACSRILSSSVLQALKLEYKKKREKEGIVIFDKISGHLLVFNPSTNSWRRKHEMNDDMKENCFSALVHGEYIYVFMENKTVYRLKYSDDAAKWEKMAEMREEHGDCPPVVAVDGLFYLLGGHNYCSTRSFERYNPQTDTWEKLQDIPDRSRFAALVVIEDIIYSFGGYVEGNGWVNKVQKFDPKTSKWSELTPMKEEKGIMTAVECDGVAYVLGGFYKSDMVPTNLPSCDSYNPKTNEWKTLASMNISRSWFRAFAIDGYIYAVGGYHSTSNTIEKYDMDKNEWKMVSMPMSINLRILESVLVKLV